MRRVAPVAAAQRQRDLGGEEVLGAEVQLGDVAGLVGLVQFAHILVDGDEVVDQIRVRHMHRVEVDGEHGDRPDRDARAVDVRDVKHRVGGLDEVELGARVRGEGRRGELRPLFVDGAGGELVVRRPLHAAGEGDVVHVLGFVGVAADVAGGLHGDAGEVACVGDAEGECRLVEALVARGGAEGERADLERPGDADRPLLHPQRAEERKECVLRA